MAQEVFSPLAAVNEDLQNKILELALTKKKDMLVKKYPVKVKGFMDLKKAPVKLLSREYKRSELINYILFTTDVLKIWFNAEIHLRESVRKILLEKNYKISEPEFNGKFLYRKLAPKDVFNDGTLSYFYPGGKRLPDFDPDEVTLMAFLLGWHPSHSNQSKEPRSTSSKSGIKSKNEPKVSIKELIDKKLKDIKNTYILYQEAAQQLYKVSDKQQFPSDEQIIQITELSKAIKQLSEDIKNDLVKIACEIKYPEQERLNSIASIKELEEVSSAIFSYEETVRTKVSLVKRLEETIKLGERISCLNEPDFVPVKKCRLLCEALRDSLDKFEKDNGLENLQAIVEKTKPVEDFIELIKDFGNKAPDEVRQNALLKSVETAFGNVDKEFFRGKLKFIAELPPEIKPPKQIKEDKTKAPEQKSSKSKKEKGAKESIPVGPEDEAETVSAPEDSALIIPNESRPKETDVIPAKQSEEKEQELSLKKEDIANITNRINTSVEIKDEGNKTLLNLLLWNLLAEGKYELSFHLAKAIEQVGMVLEGRHLPSWMIRASILSHHVLYDHKEIARLLKSDFEHYSEDIFDGLDKETKNKLKIFLVASSFRPYLLSPSSDASKILFTLKIKDQPKLNDVVSKIGEYAQNIPIDINVLKKRQIGVNYTEEVEKRKQEIKQWREHALTKSFRGKNPVTLVWRAWISDSGLIGSLIKGLILNSDTSIEYLREVIKDFKDKDSIEEKAARTFRKLKGEQLKLRMENKSLEWLFERVYEFIEVIYDWIDLLSSNPNRRKDYYEEEIDRISSDVAKIEEETLNTLSELVDADDLIIKVAASHFRESFVQVSRILKGEITISEEVDPLDLLNSILLKVEGIQPSKDLDLHYSDTFLMKLINFIGHDEPTWEEVFDLSVRNKNHFITAKVLEKLKYLGNELNIAKLATFRSEAIVKCRQELNREIQRTKDVIESAVGLGYVMESRRTDLIDEIEKIEQRKLLTDEIDFQDEINKLKYILEELNDDKIREAKKILRTIPESIREADRQRIEMVLSEGDIFTANEYISKLENGYELPLNDGKTDILADFFPSKADNINNYASNSNNDIIRNIERRTSFCDLDLQNIDPNQARKAADMLKSWYSLKNKHDVERNLKDLFSAIGFEDIVIDKYQLAKGSDRAFCNLNTKPVIGKEKCPIPEFASKANGNYRVFTFWKKEPMESFVNDIKDENSRKPVIALFMGRLTTTMRRELGFYCRERRVTAITIDETLIIYLCSVRGSRLPVLFKLTLPFTYNEPFIITASNLPTEMFYGRKTERDAIKNTHDTSIIYGGRQLGKTALLREIEKEYHNPSAGEIAIMIDLKAEGIGFYKSTTDLTNVLINEFNKLNLNILPAGIHSNITFERFIKYLEDWLNFDINRRILLFLDEADRFLELDAKDQFQITSRIKSAMEGLDRRFKVVFAGLHNVQRTTRLPNNPIAHLGKPICIGPLLNNFESIEARALILNPLESLGFRFEKDYLVTRILSQTNYYPSLIQVYCYNLLNYLYHQHFAINSTPPYIITERHITEAYKHAKELIKQKFTLTLDLDERYSLITYVIAQGILESDPAIKEKSVNGFTVNWIRDRVLDYWAEGFKHSSSYDGIKALLEEMVGLGILREVGQEKDIYTLRSPNLLSLLGDLDYVEEQILKERELSPDYAPDIYRVEYGLHGMSLRSPISSSDYNHLLGSRNGVSIIRGSNLLGLGHLKEFLTTRLKDSVHYLDTENSSLANALKYFKDISDKRIKGRNTIIVISQNTPYTESWILRAKEFVESLKSKESYMNIVFEMGPDMIYGQLKKSLRVFDMFQNEGIKLIDLKLWERDVIKEWLRDIGCDTVDCEALTEVTGSYHSELYNFVELAFNHPENWKTVLTEIEKEKDETTHQDLILEEAGLTNNIHHLFVILDSFVEFKDEFLATDEIHELNIETGIKIDEIKITLGYLEVLEIVNRSGDTYGLNKYFLDLLLRRKVRNTLS